MSSIRKPAVAGTFYPSSPENLHQMVQGMLADKPLGPGSSSLPRAIVVPHAGYVYSGEVAAQAYNYLRNNAGRFTHVAILGPSHQVALRGMALSSADYFQTPLGDVQVDQQICRQLAQLPHVSVDDQAHKFEHSLEVQLPFLQELLGPFKLVPIVVGETSPEDIYPVLELLSQADQVLIIISTDLSHYETYEQARIHDKKTSESIQELNYEAINYGDACGRNPLNGLLYFARKKNLHVVNVALQNSGDVAGDHDRVVGYGSYLIQ